MKLDLGNSRHLQGIERQELRITLFKTNRSHNATLSSCAVEDLKKLNVEFNFIQEECKYKYLFGKIIQFIQRLYLE
jgi:hypothetical protein